MPPPVLLMLRVCEAGLTPPWVAVKDRLVGLAPMAGPTEGTGAEGGEINRDSSGISAANLRMDRPPAPPILEPDTFSVLAAASGMAPVGAVLTAVDPVAAADNGVTLMVARGTAAATPLLGDDDSLD